MQNTIKINLWTDVAYPWCYVAHNSFEIAKKNFLKNNPDKKIELIIHNYMIDPNTKKLEKIIQNIIKEDEEVYDLKERGKKYGCFFSNWKFWPNTLLAHQLILKGRLNNKSEEILKECFLLTYENGENVSLESTINKIGNKFDITDWNNKNIEKEVLEEDMIAKDNYGIDVLNKNLKK